MFPGELLSATDMDPDNRSGYWPYRSEASRNLHEEVGGTVQRVSSCSGAVGVSVPP